MIPSVHLDIDAIFTSETLICVLFAMVLYIMARRFGGMKGSERLAQAFMVSGLATCFFLTSGHIPLLVGVLVTNVALLVANLLFYDGVDALLGVKPKLIFPAAIALFTLFPLTWYTVIDNRIDVRIVLLSATDCLMQLWLLIDLLRFAKKGFAVRMLAASVMLSMTTDVLRGLAVMRSAPAEHILHHPTAQVAYMIMGLLASCGLGIFSLLLVTGEIMEGIERSARRDTLTNVFNRRGIEELLSQELDRAARAHSTLSIALIDVDNFKTINDTWGHPTGDAVLRDIAACIAANLRSYDICGRIGGDEFMILLPSTSALAASQICERILQNVAALKPQPGAGIAPTISLGFTEFDLSDTPESIVARADRALYAAKREGRNSVRENVAPFRMPHDVYPTPPSLRRAPSQPALPAARVIPRRWRLNV